MGRADHVIFFGTPEVAVGPLEAIVAAGFVVDLVVTGVDKRRGRGLDTSPSPVKNAALGLGLTVSHDIDDAVKCAHSVEGSVVGVVVAYGHIISTDVLQQIAMINIHYSLLPRWRGAAPVERALLAGDEQTGVCIMQVVQQLDAGDICARASTPIDKSDTVATLRQRLETIAQPLLIHVLTDGVGRPFAQQGAVVMASKITSVDLEIDWSQDASVIDRQIRVGGAFTSFNGKRLKIHRAQIGAVTVSRVPGALSVVQGAVVVSCSVGSIVLIQVQQEGKPRIDSDDWVQGARLTPNSRFGS